MVSWAMARAVLLTFTAVMLYYTALYVVLKLFQVSIVRVLRLLWPRRPKHPAP